MKWIRYAIETTTRDADMVAAVLAGRGILDVQIEDNVPVEDELQREAYGCLAPEPLFDDGKCTIDFYLEYSDPTQNSEENTALIDGVKSDLKDAEKNLGLAPVVFHENILDSEDWENKWKAFFKPFTVNDILIKPTWEEVPNDLTSGSYSKQGDLSGYKAVIDIDPGMAFGTGRHETTRLCIREINKYIKGGDIFLDLGCGSGILSIAALKLGAARAVCADIDASAIKVAEENFNANGIESSAFSLITGNVATDCSIRKKLESSPADIAAANILAETVTLILPFVHEFIKSGGIFIASGILDYQLENVLKAATLNPDLEIIGTEQDGEWVSATFARRI